MNLQKLVVLAWNQENALVNTQKHLACVNVNVQIVKHRIQAALVVNVLVGRKSSRIDIEPCFSVDKYQTSIKRLESIYKDINTTVTEVSKWRCPYKNVQDLCTANFGCRNNDEGKCIGSDKLDYRSAWEIQKQHSS